MISLERVDIQNVNWDEVYKIGEINIFQTCEWLALITEALNAEPVVAEIKSSGHIVGYFTGLIVRKYGLKILGSPFRGWGTYFMGFNLKQDISRDAVLDAFPKFAFKDLECHYFEIVDPNLKHCPKKNSSFTYTTESLPWYAFDLTKSEDVLLANMSKSRRKNIRLSIERGVVVEEATDVEFMDEYFAQFTDAMKRHSIAPLYNIEYLRAMYKKFLPTGNLLLLRAKDSNGLCIATQIVLSLNNVAIGWGAASWHEYQHWHPNERLDLEVIKLMKTRGMKILHVGGQAEEYKQWMGCVNVEIVRIKKARYAPLDFLFNLITSPQNSIYRSLLLRKFGSMKCNSVPFQNKFSN